MQQNALAAQKTVVNVRFDQVAYRNQQQHNPSTLSEMYDVLENEIVVIKKNQRVVDNFRLPRIQSWWSEGADVDAYKFYGIAVTPHKASLKYLLHQGFVACLAGICKATNESNSTIHTGDLLTYDVNSSVCKERGVPRNKCRFTFVKYDPTDLTHVRRGIVAKALSNAKEHATFDVQIKGQKHDNHGWKQHVGDPTDANAADRFDKFFGVTR